MSLATLPKPDTTGPDLADLAHLTCLPGEATPRCGPDLAWCGTHLAASHEVDDCCPDVAECAACDLADEMDARACCPGTGGGE